MSAMFLPARLSGLPSGTNTLHVPSGLDLRLMTGLVIRESLATGLKSTAFPKTAGYCNVKVTLTVSIINPQYAQPIARQLIQPKLAPGSAAIQSGFWEKMPLPTDPVPIDVQFVHVMPFA